MRRGDEECAGTNSKDSDSQKERSIADTWTAEMGGRETGHDIVGAEAGGVDGASDVAERDSEQDVAGVDTNKGKQCMDLGLIKFGAFLVTLATERWPQRKKEIDADFLTEKTEKEKKKKEKKKTYPCLVAKVCSV